MHRTLPQTSNTEGVDQLANEIGDLPQARELAEAYIEQTNISYPQYIERLNAEKEEGDSNILATILRISVNELKKQSPEALECLRISACLAPNIPVTLFGSEGEDFSVLNQRLEPLLKLSFFTHEGETFSIDPLIQAAMREQITPNQKWEIFQNLLPRLKRTWEFDKGNRNTWPYATPLVPHLAFVCKFAEEEFSSQTTNYFEKKFSLQIATFLNELGLYSSFVGNRRLAVEYFTKSLEMKRNSTRRATQL